MSNEAAEGHAQPVLEQQEHKHQWAIDILSPTIKSIPEGAHLNFSVIKEFDFSVVCTPADYVRTLDQLLRQKLLTVLYNLHVKLILQVFQELPDDLREKIVEFWSAEMRTRKNQDGQHYRIQDSNILDVLESVYRVGAYTKANLPYFDHSANVRTVFQDILKKSGALCGIQCEHVKLSFGVRSVAKDLFDLTMIQKDLFLEHSVAKELLFFKKDLFIFIFKKKACQGLLFGKTF